MITQRFIHPQDFGEFTYPRCSHFLLFDQYNYDLELYGYKFDSNRIPLKHYTDLLVFSFIKQNLPAGSKLLEVGGGDSRILRYFRHNYECWNIDKLEGLGQGPKQVDASGYHLVRDYMGNFNSELPNAYFDFVFSISALEHSPNDLELFDRILRDIQRVLKLGSYSLHCFDIITGVLQIWFSSLKTRLLR